MGKRPGTRNRATIIAEEMLDCETRPLLRGAIEDAKDGDRVMSRFCLARIIPPRRVRLAGIDPASARAMRDIEEKLAAFIDTPELQRADAEADDAEEADGEPLLIDGMDPHEALNARLEATGRRYKESGTLPNLWFSSFMELLGWSTAYDDVEDEAAGVGEEQGAAEQSLACPHPNPPPPAGEGVAGAGFNNPPLPGLDPGIT